MYDLKLSFRMCNQNFDTYVFNLKFERSKFDYYVYFKYDNDYFLVISLYVDDVRKMVSRPCIYIRLPLIVSLHLRKN